MYGYKKYSRAEQLTGTIIINRFSYKKNSIKPITIKRIFVRMVCRRKIKLFFVGIVLMSFCGVFFTHLYSSFNTNQIVSNRNDVTDQHIQSKFDKNPTSLSITCWNEKNNFEIIEFEENENDDDDQNDETASAHTYALACFQHINNLNNYISIKKCNCSTTPLYILFCSLKIPFELLFV